MRPFASLLVPSLVLLALFGCDSAARKDPAAQAASDSLSDSSTGDANLDSFLVRRYGRVVDTAGTAPAEGWTLRICADSVVALEGLPHRIVVVCRTNEEGSHADGGLSDAYLFRLRGTRLVQVAQDTALESGSSGTPGDVSLLRLGRDLWAVQTVSGYIGQGNFEESQEWRVFDGDSGRSVLSLSTLSSNEGAMDCSEDSTACSVHSTRTLVDASDTGLARYPVDLLDTLRVGGALQARRVRIAFDSAAGSWTVPSLPGEAPDGN